MGSQVVVGDLSLWKCQVKCIAVATTLRVLMYICFGPAYINTFLLSTNCMKFRHFMLEIRKI